MNGTKDIQLIKSTLCVFIFILRILNWGAKREQVKFVEFIMLTTQQQDHLE